MVRGPPVEKHWIDDTDARIRQEPTDLVQWWSVFQDPALNHLVDCAARQNLTLREAGFRILEARAAVGNCRGQFLPAGTNGQRWLPKVGQQRRQPPNVHRERAP